MLVYAYSRIKNVRRHIYIHDRMTYIRVYNFQHARREYRVDLRLLVTPSEFLQYLPNEIDLGISVI